MSYEVLARRWRPQTFDDVSGQRHVTITLRNAIRLDRLAHAILLAGPRGVGKTSIARILARSLNCDEGPTEKPCGNCGACRDISAGTSLDVQEIDAASNTGIDNVRDIRESIRYAAAPGKYRIFIIDEVHMLSQAAFNALLKTLEEPPPQSLFVFATTDPQRIPQTVLSRVQRFDLRRLSSADVAERLRAIIEAESLEVPESIVRALVREGDGSLRDSLTLLDRLTSGLGAAITEEEANAVLDLVDRRVLVDVLTPVLEGRASDALGALRRALDRGVDPARFSQELQQELRNLVVACVAEDAELLIDAAAEEVAAIRERAAPHDAERLQQLFRVLLSRHEELAWAPRPAHALEMTIVRLATPPATASVSALIERLDALGADAPQPGGGGERGGSAGGASSGGGGVPRPRRAPPAPTPPAEAPAPAERGGGAAGAPREQDRHTRLRQEAKAHPAVEKVIQTLDAELREIRVRADEPKPEVP